MEQKKIRVGVIGAGAIAHVAHFPSLASMEDVEMRAVLCGHFEKAQSAARQFGITTAVRDLDEFLRQGLDCAVLLTPKTVRKEYLLPLLDAGLDVLVEKPLATTIDECANLAELSVKSGRIVMVAFNRRFSPVNKGGIEAFGGIKPEYVLAQKNREFKEYRGRSKMRSTWWTCCDSYWASRPRSRRKPDGATLSRKTCARHRLVSRVDPSVCWVRAEARASGSSGSRCTGPTRA